LQEAGVVITDVTTGQPVAVTPAAPVAASAKLNPALFPASREAGGASSGKLRSPLMAACMAILALSGGSLALSACSAQAVAQVSATAAYDLNLIANGITAEIPVINSLSPAVATDLQTAVSDLQAAASLAGTIGTATAQNSAQSAVTQVASDIEAAVVALNSSGVALPASVSSVLSAAEVLIPEIEIALNMALPSTASAPYSMTPAQARAALLAATNGASLTK
jgi:hypothetical protein